MVVRMIFFSHFKGLTGFSNPNHARTYRHKRHFHYAAVINKIEVGGVTVVSQNALVVSLGASFLERASEKSMEVSQFHDFQNLMQMFFRLFLI